MNAPALLVFQFTAPIAIGFAIACYLRVVTRRLLMDLCGTADRAEFWVRVTTVLLVAGPLVLALIAARNPLDCQADDAICLEVAVRQTLVFSLLGALAAVGVVASRIARYLPRNLSPDMQPARAAETSA
ncbi:hypothetical protein [Burkholderia sp. Ac-20353]|uniref:hypothetical protein n=1 Tax=Burkholderia sp. Ac-20353 TaxID=2703894 RepID=UPI00197BEB2A|nr:hypothetical protein [Burkholderia sp. Ac-20353]MBN3788433.1 hypothetical protein [Burkholderia sp. Ac-20353]